jgi:hypothetical protein
MGMKSQGDIGSILGIEHASGKVSIANFATELLARSQILPDLICSSRSTVHPFLHLDHVMSPSLLSSHLLCSRRRIEVLSRPKIIGTNILYVWNNLYHKLEHFDLWNKTFSFFSWNNVQPSNGFFFFMELRLWVEEEDELTRVGPYF